MYGLVYLLLGLRHDIDCPLCNRPSGLPIAGTVGQTEFDQAILRAVAGVEKKRSMLQGAEKESVAKHECGHALVSTAVASLIPTSPQVSACT